LLTPVSRYLVDQFIQDKTNQRTDAWGGSIEKRARFALEVAGAVSAAIGPGRTAIRLSPWSTFQGMRMADPVPQFTYVISELSKLKLAYLHMTESRVQGDKVVEAPEEQLDWALRAWGGVAPVVLAGAFKLETAKKEVDETKGTEIIIAFGRDFI
jgi:NADPH2 dehydrogenase